MMNGFNGEKVRRDAAGFLLCVCNNREEGLLPCNEYGEVIGPLDRNGDLLPEAKWDDTSGYVLCNRCSRIIDCEAMRAIAVRFDLPQGGWVLTPEIVPSKNRSRD